MRVHVGNSTCLKKKKNNDNKRIMSELNLEGHIDIHKIEREEKYFMQKKQHVQTHKDKQITTINSKRLKII